MEETSQQQQTTGQSTGAPPATLPLSEQSPDVSPSVASQSVIPSQLTVPPPGGQSSNTPQLVPPTQRKRRVIVKAIAAVLICLVGGGMLWQVGFAWYIAVLPILALILISLIILGYIPRWSMYTGFGEYKSPYSKDQDAQRAKTVWDWLNLLGVFLIPLMIGVFTIASNIQQSNISQQQHNTDIAIALDQQREVALQAYLGQMSDLLLVDNLRKSKSGDEVRQVARARTLTVLRSLDPARKGYLLQFLYEANLINKNDVIVDLSGADLSYADLRFTTLSDADLSGADLKFANLSYADLSEANLHRANLSFASLSRAILKKADLRFAIFYKAEVTNKQLAETPLLSGTILPDGSIHP